MPFDRRSSLSPAPGMMPGKLSRTQQQFLESARTASSQEHERDLRTIKNFLADYVDTPVTVAGVTYTVLARRGTTEGEAEAAGMEPWLCEKLATRTMRVHPSSIADGLGHYVWPTYNGVRSTPESVFDIPIPLAPLTGWLWVECTVDDNDDLHGELVECELKIGARPTIGFSNRVGTTVNIAIAEYASLAANTTEFTLNPRRNFNLILRRFGPPGSLTWDVEIS